MVKSSDNAKLKTVSKALEVLIHFSRHPRSSWSLAQLSAELAMHKTTVLRILTTLEHHAFLVRDPSTLRYRLGPAVLTLASAAESRIRQLAVPVLQELTTTTGETSLLHILSGSESFCIERAESTQPVRVTFDVGRRASVHAGATGKALLAFLDKSTLESVLNDMKWHRFTERTTINRKSLMSDLSTIREQGFAASCGELHTGVCAVAAPVLSSGGELEASITLVYPESRWSAERQASYADAVKMASNQLGRAIG